MVEKDIHITNPSGLHTRPAKKLVDTAKSFSCDISVRNGEKEGSAKNLIKMMKLGITVGNTIHIQCDGTDEEAALESISSIITGLTG